MTFISPLIPANTAGGEFGGSVSKTAGPFLTGNFRLIGIDLDNSLMRFEVQVFSGQDETGIDNGYHQWDIYSRWVQIDVPISAFNVESESLLGGGMTEDGTETYPEWSWTPPTP